MNHISTTVAVPERFSKEEAKAWKKYRSLYTKWYGGVSFSEYCAQLLEACRNFQSASGVSDT